MSRTKSNSKAFSLVELSIVILIITVLVVGIIGAQSLLTKSRLVSARAQTSASPVLSVDNLSLWLESTLERSFGSSDISDNAALASWNDIGNNKLTSTQVSGGPVYNRAINKMPTAAFSGTGHFTFDGSFLNGRDYTIFAVEQRSSSASDNYFLGDGTVSGTNRFALGYKANGQISQDHGAFTYSAAVSGYSANEPKIITFSSNSAGKKIYINGMLAKTSADTLAPTGITNLAVGKGYNGQIGEVIVFAKSLQSEERKKIEDYLSKKWVVKTSSLAVDCSAGVVTGNSCNINICTMPSYSASPSVTTGSGSVGCTSGYSGSLNYTCAGGGGPATITGGSCNVVTCAVTGTGIAGGTTVASGATEVTCNATGYSVTTATSATCSGSALTATCGSGNCNTGGGYIWNGSACVSTGSITCSITGFTGITNATGLAYSTSPVSRNCDVAGYVTNSGVTYTCTASGAASMSGTCTAISCTFPAITGISAPPTKSYAASPTSHTCNQTEYSSISYTCTGTVNPGTTTLSAGNPSGGPFTACACAAGYAWNGSFCNAIFCTASGTGVSSQSVPYQLSPGSGSLSCSGSATGTPSYTCTQQGNNVSVTGCACPSGTTWNGTACTSPCGSGTLVSGKCWYLSGYGQTCNSFCPTIGKTFDASATTSAGHTVLEAMGHIGLGNCSKYGWGSYREREEVSFIYNCYFDNDDSTVNPNYASHSEWKGACPCI